MTATLIRPLPPGPLDIVADVHGEIDALKDLLRHLGYRDGVHPDGRTLVFVGDLVDRGPDSPGVVALVRDLMTNGARCVLGNHELNLLLGKRKPHHVWFHPLPDAERRDILDFFATLPLALERDDVRVVHAAWCDDAAGKLRDAVCVRDAFSRHEAVIAAKIALRTETEWAAFDAVRRKVAGDLLHQNDNPVKLLNSGPETWSDTPVVVEGHSRHTGRRRWWDDYAGPLVVVGHYWRGAGTKPTTHHLFDDSRPHALLGRGQVMCIDYSVGWRFEERAGKPADYRGPFRTKLAALRHPEMTLAFDDGSTARVDAA